MYTIVSKRVLSSKYYPATEILCELKILFLKMHQCQLCSEAPYRELY